ncbi:hypothetical protein D4S03_01095 [bacterium]|nr:MAG: hypothetical protein D4S03_01095 [bacterium]
MIKIEFLKESMGHEIGEIKEYSDNHSGIIRAWIIEGRVCKVEPEKIKHLEVKMPEKVQTHYAPKTIKRKRK